VGHGTAWVTFDSTETYSCNSFDLESGISTGSSEPEEIRPQDRGKYFGGTANDALEQLNVKSTRS